MITLATAIAVAVTATICHDAPIPEAVTDEIVMEATAVLRDAGVALTFVASGRHGCDEETGSLADVLVRIDGAAVREPTLSRCPVASIQFIGGRPDRVITLSVSGGRHLLRQDPWARALLGHVPARVADRLLGRMLGRALAHEMGHYLLRSSSHSARGLMRASQRVEALLNPARTPFRFTAKERGQLHAESERQRGSRSAELGRTTR